MSDASLRQREAFHLGFLRALGRSLPPHAYALKGGSNLRFFFGSVRYSEDMDLDVAGIPVETLRERVMAILGSAGLSSALHAHGVRRIAPPDLGRAKQTETVQRFKVHLHTASGEDLPTKIEFSRRGLDAPLASESVSPALLAEYHMPPMVASHYPLGPALRQKLAALAGRRQPEARDVFDLYMLGMQAKPADLAALRDLPPEDRKEARERVHATDFARFRDTVLDLFAEGDRLAHGTEAVWDEIRLQVLALLERAERA